MDSDAHDRPNCPSNVDVEVNVDADAGVGPSSCTRKRSRDQQEAMGSAGTQRLPKVSFPGEEATETETDSDEALNALFEYRWKRKQQREAKMKKRQLNEPRKEHSRKKQGGKNAKNRDFRVKLATQTNI